ncbi:hypothetical protein CEXT_717531 [Caerostris extrusa]|uniref:Secreted protein n=1 Tax=Caerostris extrusa TaxID=172846 RepID=A0AAV4UQ88_CAEEX|nr:hypothetical protein CEXT_717531 [Caerostris extrusa]
MFTKVVIFTILFGCALSRTSVKRRPARPTHRTPEETALCSGTLNATTTATTSPCSAPSRHPNGAPATTRQTESARLQTRSNPANVSWPKTLLLSAENQLVRFQCAIQAERSRRSNVALPLRSAAALILKQGERQFRKYRT